MSTFTLLVDLQSFTGEDVEGIDVTVKADPRFYPIAGQTTHVGATTRKTNAQGDVEFTLLAAEGLTYVVSSPAFAPRRISGDRLPDVVVRFDQEAPVTPSPIAPVDAAALRAEHNADVATINAAIAALQAGGGGPSGPVEWVDVQGKPTDIVFQPKLNEREGAIRNDLMDAIAARASSTQDQINSRFNEVWPAIAGRLAYKPTVADLDAPWSVDATPVLVGEDATIYRAHGPTGVDEWGDDIFEWEPWIELSSADVDALAAEVATLSTSVDSVNSNLGSLWGNIGNLQDQIDNLPEGGSGGGGGAELPDTGWRKMPYGWPNAGNGNQLVRRVGNVVTVVVEGTYHGSAFSFPLEVGFRPRWGYRVDDTNGFYKMNVSNSGVAINYLTDPSWVNIQSSFTTEDPWPTTLPGEAFESTPATLPTGLFSNGSPEGVMAAPVGTEYTDLAATNGAVKWVKMSGTDTTGWRVTVGDTGWRLVTNTLDNGAVVELRLRRTEAGVFAQIQVGDPGTPASWNQLVVLPSGFQSGATWIGLAAKGSYSNVSGTFYASNSIYIECFAGSPAIGSLGPWVGPSGWPTTLPGTPA